MQYTIEMNNISKKFGEKKVIDDLNVNIKSGEVIGFLGPSGAGKTTTIKILTGQLKQDSGNAKILGKDTTTLNNEIYGQIGIVTDNSGLYENLNAYDNLLLFSRILGTDKSIIKTLINKVGLGNDIKKLVKNFSKGMKQRLVLARAMLNEPKILFLDEPTSGLDPSTAIEIHSLMLEMRNQGTTFFLTTHNMQEATKLCDRIALFDKGKIVDIGTMDELSQRHNTDKKIKILTTSGEVLILPISPESSHKITELLNNNEIVNIHSQEPTLEQIFLKLTGREL